MSAWPVSADVLSLNPALADDLRAGRFQVKAALRHVPGRGEYKNALEEVAARTWVAPQFFWWGYETVRLRHAGGWITPDFFCVHASGRIVVVEVKGSWAMKNARAARVKLLAAAEQHPWAIFVALTPIEARREHGQLLVGAWSVEFLGGGAQSFSI